MNWKDLPIDETRREIRVGVNPTKSFIKIVDYGRQKLQSKIWSEFENMNIERDIKAAEIWLNQTFKKFPGFSGIYLD